AGSLTVRMRVPDEEDQRGGNQSDQCADGDMNRGGFPAGHGFFSEDEKGDAYTRFSRISTKEHSATGWLPSRPRTCREVSRTSGRGSTSAAPPGEPKRAAPR